MFLNVRNLKFQHSARFGPVLKLSGNTFFDIALLLSLFSDLRELEGIDFRSDFRSKNDFFRNFFSDLKSAPKITYTHCPFLLNIYSVQKIKNPTWLSLTMDVIVYPTNITMSIRPLVGQLIGLINSASKWASATNASNTNMVPVRVSPS